MNAETKAAFEALTDPSVRSEVVKVIADADNEAQDFNRDDAVESLTEWVRRKDREGDPYVLKHLRLQGVDWYAVVDALEADYQYPQRPTQADLDALLRRGEPREG